MTIPRQMIGSVLAAYTVFVFALSTNAFLTVFVRGNDPADVTQGAPVMRAAWGAVYLLTFVGAIIRWRQVAATLHANSWLLFLILLAFVSALWSIDPGRTLHGAFLLLFTALYAIDLNIRFTMEKQLQFLCGACVLLVSLSIFVELAMPGFVPGPDFRDAAWHGVFKSKNTLGEVGTLGVAACLTLPLRSKLIRALAIVCGIFVQVLAHSVGSMICLAAIVGLFAWLPILKWRPKARKIALILTAGTGLFAVCLACLNFAQATALTGHDTSMNRRSELWRLSLAYIDERPVLGYGFAAFWSKTSQPARRIREEVRWEDAPHSHNGYIEIALGLGLVGLVVYGLVIIGAVRRAYFFFMSGQENHKRWPLMYLAIVSLHQLSESSILSGGALVWILFCSVLFSLPQPEKEWVGSHVMPLGEFAR
jgi:exopolysaccharide production protein ExoQ